MTPRELYRQAVALGLRLEAQGDRLAVSPRDRLTPALADALKAHKAELLQWLTASPCAGFGAVPPVDLPLNALAPYPTLADRERVIAYLLHQGCDRPAPLTAWLLRRENAYYEGPGRRWDCAMHAYAAARDAACWQLNCEERDLWQTLAGFNQGHLTYRSMD